jgi:hypothetical protein
MAHRLKSTLPTTRLVFVRDNASPDQDFRRAPFAEIGIARARPCDDADVGLRKTCCQRTSGAGRWTDLRLNRHDATVSLLEGLHDVESV